MNDQEPAPTHIGIREVDANMEHGGYYRTLGCYTPIPGRGPKEPYLKALKRAACEICHTRHTRFVTYVDHKRHHIHYAVCTLCRHAQRL